MKNIYHRTRLSWNQPRTKVLKWLKHMWVPGLWWSEYGCNRTEMQLECLESSQDGWVKSQRFILQPIRAQVKAEPRQKRKRRRDVANGCECFLVNANGWRFRRREVLMWQLGVLTGRGALSCSAISSLLISLPSSSTPRGSVWWDGAAPRPEEEEEKEVFMERIPLLRPLLSSWLISN